MSRLSLLVGVLLLTGCAVLPPPPRSASTELPLRTLVINTTPLMVEVAADQASRSQGLSDRASLPEGRGMLFTFDTPGRYEFWMNRMRFGLDFLWVSHGKVVEVTQNVPPTTPQTPEPVYLTPHQPVDAVIEVPAGWISLHQITVGADVDGLESD